MPTVDELRAEIAKRKRAEQVRGLIAQRQQEPKEPLIELQDLLAQQSKRDNQQDLGPRIAELRQQTNQPDSGELAVKSAGIGETLFGTERERLRPELEELPEFAASERGGALSGEGFKIAAGLLSTADPKEQQDIIKSIIPEATFKTSNDGTTTIEVPDGKGGRERSVLNKPGMSQQDFLTGIAQALAFVPAAKLAGLGKGLLAKVGIGAAASGTTEQLRQEAVIGQGSEQGRHPEQTAIAAGLGGGAEVIAPFLSRFKRFLGSTPEGEAASVIQTGKETGTSVLTSDVIQPKTFIGRSFQQLGEKIGVLGSGGARAEQQIARQDIVQSIADDFGIQNVNDDFLPSIIDSMTKKQAKGLEKASITRNEVVNKLKPLGEVPATNTVKAIDRAIAHQNTLKGKADQSLISDLETTKQSIVGDFEHVKNIRSDVIADLKAVRRGEDTRSIPALQSVKSAIDKDMVIFSRKSQKELGDKTIVRDWLSSNREFAFELGKGKDAVLKRLLDSGEAKPSSISPILRSGDPTQMRKLKSSLTEKGRNNASAAIVKDALETSKFFTSANPDLFVNAISKPKFQKAVEVFFTQEQKDSLKGLTRLLQATRRAQSAPVAVASAQQTVPVGVLAASTAEPFTAFLTGGTLAAVTRGYESKFVRNALLKLAASKRGSAAEAAILKELQPIISNASQVARQTESNIEGEQ